MRFVVISDSHGRKGNVFDIIEMHIEDADYFLCLGDCNDGDDFEYAQAYFKEKLRLKRVCGNCDWYSTEPAVREITLKGKRILFCHGHTFKVKFGYEMLIEEAKRRKADVVIFGHTHNPYYEYRDGLHIFNPGAAQDGRYGMVDITDSGIICINARL